MGVTKNMKKIKNINISDGQFKNKQRENIKIYYDLCKKNLFPSITTGALTAGAIIQIYGPGGVEEVLIFGGITGAALMLAINGIVTGIKVSKNKKNEIKEQLEQVEEKGKGKHL